MLVDQITAAVKGARRFAIRLFAPACAALLWLLRIRFLWITNPDRIGHLAAEPDAYLKQKRLGDLPWHIGVLVAPSNMVANRSLLALWEKVIPSVSSPVATRRLMFAFWRFRFLWIEFSEYVAADIHQPATYYEILSKWGSRAPILKLPPELTARGDTALSALGVPADAWLVCIHVREAGYSQRDDHLHEYRNCSIENYYDAVDEAVSRGGWCVRMGDSSMTELRSHPRFIDYANSPMRSDWMDLYLCGRCQLFVGTTSGLIMLPTVLGRTCVTTNFVPISRPPVSPLGLGIPKLLRERKTGRLLTFAEMVAGELHMSYTTRDSIPEIEILENSPEDIRKVVTEALDELHGKDIFDAESRARARRFLSIYPSSHFASHAQSRISPAFLRKYEYLLPPA